MINTILVILLKLDKSKNKTKNNFFFQKIWKVRETVIEALLKLGYVYSFDISLPLSRFYEIVELTREKLKDIEDVKAVCGFGHIGKLKNK